jgi:pimeloyl-ACP methyl ester carboxylesterase
MPCREAPKLRAPTATAAAQSCLLSALAGCGGHDAGASRVNEAPAARTLLVVFEGYNNCNGSLGTTATYAWERLRDLTAALRGAGRQQVDVLVSCFGARGFDLRYAESDHTTARAVSSIDEMIGVARRAATRTPGRTAVHVVGHSHGGWLGMRFALDTDIPIASLTTIDPISYPRCQPEDIARWALDSLFRLRDNAGCQAAPIDLAVRFGDVRRRVGRWDNFYQQEFLALHSGPAQPATTNTRYGYGRAPMDHRSHEDIKNDPRVWAAVRASVLAP